MSTHPEPAPLVGILGGLGPVSTARLHTEIVRRAAAAGAVEDTDFPRLLIASAPAAGLTAAGTAQGGFLAATQAGLDLLVRAGAAVVASACNTLDAYRPQLHLPPTVPYLSAVATAAAAVPATTRRVGVLTSATSRDHGLYEAALPGRDIVYAADQERVERAIAAGMANRLDPDDLDGLIRQLRDAGAETVILGCTELHTADATVLDSVHTLADAVVGWVR